MTKEKKKAKELVEKFKNTGNYEFQGEMHWSDLKPKIYALICCDEMLEYDLRAKSEAQFFIERTLDEYWNKVKEEINKLS